MFIHALADRVRRSGGSPLLTCYDAADDSRIELSATTFANWVDKTANLIVDLGHEDGEPIDIALATTHPGHWVTYVWIAAAWQRGCPVMDGTGDTSLLVVGPHDTGRAPTTVMCSLHPLGRALAEAPAGVGDYVEVFGQPDLHDEAIGLGEAMWSDRPIGRVTPSDERLLIADPAPGWQTVATALVAPVLGGGSTVLASGYDAGALDLISVSERARVL